MYSQLNSVSLFSGIGGISIGNPLLYVEKDYHCQRVLRARFADGCLKAAPIHDDILTLEKLPAGCDILHGGSPCQDFSAAGLKKGVLDGQRSVLFFEMTRLAAASRPKYIFFENVSNLLSFFPNFHSVATALALVPAVDDLLPLHIVLNHS